MIRVNITADSDLLRQLAASIPDFWNGKAAPNTAEAFNTATDYVKYIWQNWAMGNESLGSIGKIKHPSATLTASIKSKRLGHFDAVIYSESRRMRRIQDGTPQFDMKDTYPYGRKSRVSKKGVPYLIIPFRWGTPNANGEGRAHFVNFIPKPMFKTIGKMKTSRRLAIVDKKGEIIGGETHFEKNYAGDDIERSNYNWGGRHEGEGDMNGLVRMAGGGGYFTFRVISALQLVTAPNSWVKKAVPSVDIEGALASAATPVIEDVIEKGIIADLDLG